VSAIGFKRHLKKSRAERLEQILRKSRHFVRRSSAILRILRAHLDLFSRTLLSGMKTLGETTRCPEHPCVLRLSIPSECYEVSTSDVLASMTTQIRDLGV
jgi:hypothetical protein